MKTCYVIIQDFIDVTKPKSVEVWAAGKLLEDLKENNGEVVTPQNINVLVIHSNWNHKREKNLTAKFGFDKLSYNTFISLLTDFLWSYL